MSGNYPAGVTDSDSYFTDETECNHQWDEQEGRVPICVKCGDYPCARCDGTMGNHDRWCRIHPFRTGEGAEVAI